MLTVIGRDRHETSLGTINRDQGTVPDGDGMRSERPSRITYVLPSHVRFNGHS